MTDIPKLKYFITFSYRLNLGKAINNFHMPGSIADSKNFFLVKKNKHFSLGFLNTKSSFRPSSVLMDYYWLNCPRWAFLGGRLGHRGNSVRPRRLDVVLRLTSAFAGEG